MSKIGYKSRTVLEPDIWHGSEKTGVWERGNYRLCYLTIRRTDEGKFIPAVSGCSDINYPNVPLPPNKRFEYDTFEQAENHLFKYVDYIRDVYDIWAKNALQKRLHTLAPEVYPI